jgi:putative ABC transport system substrate-binding protein
MDRRRFLLTSLAAAVAATPHAIGAQQPAKVHRLGILSPGGVPDPSVETTPNLVPRYLRDLGYREGFDLVIERRFADGKPGRLAELARELARLRLDLIVATGTDATEAAVAATSSIPIVMVSALDPVAKGWVVSLSRPSRNVTGVTTSGEMLLAAKRLELIKETIPSAGRIALLSAGGPGAQAQIQEAQNAAAALRIRLSVVEVQAGDYDRAFSAMLADRVDAVLVLMSPVFARDHRRIVDRAARYRLPAIYEWREHVIAGGLMSYGTSLADLARRVAEQVDKILKGARPGDLPVEQPTKYELVVNLKTAQALGLTIPASLLARADQVIE